MFPESSTLIILSITLGSSGLTGSSSFGGIIGLIGSTVPSVPASIISFSELSVGTMVSWILFSCDGNEVAGVVGFVTTSFPSVVTVKAPPTKEIDKILLTIFLSALPVFFMIKATNNKPVPIIEAKGNTLLPVFGKILFTVSLR